MDKKIAERLNDRSFVEKLMGFGTPDEVKSFFKAEGLDVTDDEIKEMGNSISESLTNFQNIPDSELEVAGGGPSDIIGKLGYKIGYDLEKDEVDGYETLLSQQDKPEELAKLFKEGTSGKIGKALFVHRKGVTGATGAAAGALVAYAGYKKGWPALKALGQKKGWWK